jgi:hypothetical protein
MENALSPAEAVNVWPSILNSMLMAVCPMPLDGRGAAEGIQVLAELDEGEGRRTRRQKELCFHGFGEKRITVATYCLRLILTWGAGLAAGT